jgi:thiosulfate reductase cytochrome b subunit
MSKVKMYTRFERFWHWCQSAIILALLVTGLQIHFTGLRLLDFATAVQLHRVLAWAFLGLAALAIFWHITSGEWKQYLPTNQSLGAMVKFYLVGIFRTHEHPVRKTRAQKLNPLQRLVYLGFKILIFPVLATSGLAYMYWDAIQRNFGLETVPLSLIAVAHLAAAYIMVAFLIGHLYMITTGRTVGANLKAMITGWDEEHGATSA